MFAKSGPTARAQTGSPARSRAVGGRTGPEAGSNRLAAQLAWHTAPAGMGTDAAMAGEPPNASGQALGADARAFFEPRLGADLGRVRVRTDRQAADTATALGAQAYTVGSTIVFGPNRYSPATTAGRRLLAHELAHVVQQGGADPAGSPSTVVTRRTSPKLQRSPDESLTRAQIDAELASVVITDAHRAELEQRRAVLAQRPQFDLLALRREAELRAAAAGEAMSLAGNGPSTVTVPLSALLSPPDPLDGPGLYALVVDLPEPEATQELAARYVLAQYLAGKQDWPVTVSLIEPGEGVWFAFAVQGQDLVVSRSMALPLSALDLVSAELLKTVTDRSAQIVEAATLVGSRAQIADQAIGPRPEEMTAEPQRYARNEADGMLMLASRYAQRIDEMGKHLAPGNEWLATPLAACAKSFAPVLERVQGARSAAYHYHAQNQPPTYAGETYDRVVRESTNRVERAGWKVWRFLGNVFTLGGQSAQADNVGMYRRGEISYNDYRKNWVLAVGAVAFKAAVTALTAGRGTGLAMRFLGLETGTSAAAIVAAGGFEGATAGFAQAFASDLYAWVVSGVSSANGVVSFHRAQIGGPASWFEAAAWGSLAGGAQAAVLRFVPKAPPEGPTAGRQEALERASIEQLSPDDVQVISADAASGDITLAIRHPRTGELFAAQGNIHTGHATVRNLTTGEVVGYVRGGKFGAPVAGGELGAATTEAVGAGGPSPLSAAEPALTAAGPAETFGPTAPGAAPAFAPGRAPTSAAEVTQFLRASGLEESEIIAFGGADASRLGPSTAARVAKLAEHFDAADIKALGRFLWNHDIVIDDAVAAILVERVPTGRLSESLRNFERAASYVEQTGAVFDLAEAVDLSVFGRRAGGAADAAFGPPVTPAWRLAETALGPVLEARYGPGWRVSPRVAAPNAAMGETLGSTVPEYYHPGLNLAFEVKRLDLGEMGIGPSGPTGARPSPATFDALARARRQLAGRRWALPAGTEQSIVFNITGQGVTDVVAVGGQLRTLIGESLVTYDRLFIQDGGTLTEIP